MICKGGTRSYPTSLAQHLLKTDNERVVVVELKHTATQDLKQALNDMHATIAMTQGKKSLYHAQINPAKDEQMTSPQWLYAVDEMERRLGFVDQPRAVVYHEKKGRAHMHVVWQRTDIEKGKVIETSNDYYIHKKLGRDLERKFKHKELKAEFSENWEKMNEREQTARDGYLSPKQLKARIKQLYKNHSDPKEFQKALKKAKFDLAKGNRGLVIVSSKNQIHSLGRYTGQKKKDIEKHLKPILEYLPDATEFVKKREKQQSKIKAMNPKPKAKTIVENAFDILSRDEIGKTAAKFDKLKQEFKQKQFEKLRKEFTDNQDAFNTVSPSVREGFEQVKRDLERQNEEERKRKKEREYKR
ncbi:relaxase/mobilization nuclease domain-containing protein [uncultured Dokdonia sp.]|uniref:relaxase/mobilization nuclease domain-containing protein n=1 Tax=uncultured Dokdonia sp. TaxID=575653 RepID=UPI002618DD75|nr:relaxase/mobilization nuclease domain-containing protein [uncultured Dokdonia sp.]